MHRAVGARRLSGLPFLTITVEETTVKIFICKNEQGGKGAFHFRRSLTAVQRPTAEVRCRSTPG